MSQHRPIVRAEPDRIATGKVILVGAASLALFFAASAVTVYGLEWRRARLPPAAAPAEVGSSKIGLVEQQLFETTLTGEGWRAAQLGRLRSYGWVDRKAGIIHIPVDEAMERVLRGERP